MNSRFADVQLSIFRLFDEFPIKVYPSNYTLKHPEECIRVAAVMGNDEIHNSVSGLLLIDIFTKADEGVSKVMQVADLLSNLLNNKSFTIDDGVSMQLLRGTLGSTTQDSDLKSLARTQFQIQFTYSWRNHAY